MHDIKTIGAIGIAAAFLVAQPAFAGPKEHGDKSQGAAHMSEQGAANANSIDKEKGMDRAKDRMSEQGADHMKDPEKMKDHMKEHMKDHAGKKMGADKDKHDHKAE